MNMLRVLAVIIFLTSGGLAIAQTPTFSSPETALLYKSAREAMSRGAVKQALILYQQVAQREPNQPIFQRDLAQAYLLAGNKATALELVTTLIDQKIADETSYQIAASALLQTGERKKARKMIDAGLKQYKNSGLLYQELGKYHESVGEQEYALDAWIHGINAEPNYFLNYYSACRLYAQSNRPIWAILYGEIFINLERETARSYETRAMVFDSYKRLFASIKGVPVDTFEISFEHAVLYTYSRLSQAVAEGFTAENLTMLRTRFSIEWQSLFHHKYPYALFKYYEMLLSEGHFDAYNQWLFGKADNASQFEAWKKFHQDAIPALDKWAEESKLRLSKTDSYNPRDFRGITFKK